MPYQFTQTGAEIQDILDLARNDIAAEYDPTASYAVGDYCTYEDSMYICTGSTTGTFAPAKWSATTAGGEINSLNATLTNMSSTVYSANGDSTSVSSGTSYTLLQQVTCSAGVWLILCGAAWAQNSSGYRHIQLTTSSTAPTSNGRSNMDVQAPIDNNSASTAIVNVYSINSSTTFYLWGRQNSGSTLNAYPWFQRVRLR